MTITSFRPTVAACFFSMIGLIAGGCSQPGAGAETVAGSSGIGGRANVKADGIAVTAISPTRATQPVLGECNASNVASVCGKDTACTSFSCEAGQCVERHAELGLACGTGVAVCDGKGSCVLEHCTDQLADGDESDEDCGGASCGPCANESKCSVGHDCASAFCSHGGDSTTGSCAACTKDADCGVDLRCDTAKFGGTCVSLKDKGATCTSGAECASGFCPDQDGVCCDAACDGTCVACVHDKTGSADGSCSAVKANEDPDSECAADAAHCLADTCSGAAGFCKAAAVDTVCRESAGACDFSETCSGLTGKGCPTDVIKGKLAPCSNDMTRACDGQSAADASCKLANEQPCSDASECASNVCDPDLLACIH